LARQLVVAIEAYVIDKIRGAICNAREEIATECGEIQCYSFEIGGTITTIQSTLK